MPDCLTEVQWIVIINIRTDVSTYVYLDELPTLTYWESEQFVDASIHIADSTYL